MGLIVGLCKGSRIFVSYLDGCVVHRVLKASVVSVDSIGLYDGSGVFASYLDGVVVHGILEASVVSVDPIGLYDGGGVFAECGEGGRAVVHGVVESPHGCLAGDGVGEVGLGAQLQVSISLHAIREHLETGWL